MDSITRVRMLGLIAGPLVALLFLLGDAAGDDRTVLALAIWMAIWWMTEAIPLGVTALLPLVVLPLATTLPFSSAAGPYTNNIVFLFMGGFMLGLGLQRWGLHRRIALNMLVLVGSGGRRLIGGFMVVTALLSMWISNTATAMMLMPIAMSVVATRREYGDGNSERDRSFAVALVLGVAYAASLGGLGTKIGTPPNVIMSGFMESEYGITISMFEWMQVGMPLVLMLLPLCWLWLVFVVFRSPGEELGGAAVVREERDALGRMSVSEWRAGLVFLVVILCWMFRKQLVTWSGAEGLNDGVIALCGAIALFVLPAGQRGERLLDWEHAKALPWDILLLFGGGLSLAAAISATGADAVLSSVFHGLTDVPLFVLLAVLGLVIVFSGELTSNTAAASALMPILAALCAAGGLDPLPVFFAATLTGSCGFMLPVATPPNAIAFGTGLVSIRDMVRAGFGLNLICIGVIVTYISIGGTG